MFKRWRDRKKETEQQPESPTRENQQQLLTETSGFICPVCMISFSSPEDLQGHFETVHVKQPPSSGAFICPLCMKTFNSPGELQSHFDQQHESQIEDDATSVMPTVAPLSQSLPADTTKIWSEKHGSLLSFDEELPAPRKESEVSLLSNQLKELEDKTQEILYLQQELNELNASLKEEKWYSAALKEEVDKITKEKVDLEEKNFLLEKEKQDLEKESDQKVMAEKENSVKSMAEYAQLKVELARALEAQTGSQSEQMNLAQRTSELVIASFLDMFSSPTHNTAHFEMRMDAQNSEACHNCESK